MALPHGKRIWAGVSLLLSTAGLAAVVIASRSPQNIFSKAWSGVETNLANLGLVKPTQPNPLLGLPEDNSAKTLFTRLHVLYWDAEAQNIDIPQFNVKGVAFVKYDPAVNSTFIFSRLENMPLPEGKALRLWLAQNVSTYTRAGIAQFVSENGQPVAYSVFSGQGDLRSYQELLFSYDPPDPDIARPQLVVLSLRF